MRLFYNKYRIILIDVSLIILAILMAKWAIKITDIMPDCIFEASGFYCPACGGTSCVYNFVIGNFKEAFYQNIVVFLLSYT